MGFASSHREDVWDTAQNLAKVTREDKQNRGSLPIIVELVLIPSPFVEPSAVDGSDTIIYTSNTDFIRA